MTNFRESLHLRMTIAALLVVGLAGAATPAATADTESPGLTPTQERLSGTSLTLLPELPWERAELRIVGPAGYNLLRLFDSGLLQVDLIEDARTLRQRDASLAARTDEAPEAPEALADGRYRYELILHGADGERTVRGDVFFVEAGAAVSRAAVRDRISDARGELRDVQAARADTRSAGQAPEGFEDDFLYILDSLGDGSTYLELQSDTAEDFEFTNDQGLLTVETENGGSEVRFAIEGSSGDVGIGTSTPTAPLDIVATFPGIQMDNGGNGWRLSAFSDPAFGVRDSNTFAVPFAIFSGGSQASLGIGPAGVGAGTFTPSEPLHVFRSNGSAKLLVEEASGITAVRELFKLSNNGGPFFVFTDTSLSRSWAFASLASNDFTINQQQESGIEYRFGQTGNLTIAGTLTENSSREAKDGIEPVDGAEVLARLRQIPITTWSYDHDPERRHMGPMAEDFHAAFGLNGSAEGVANVDTTGVAFASIQAMADRIEERDQRIAELEARVEELEGLKTEIEELKRLAAQR